MRFWAMAVSSVSMDPKLLKAAGQVSGKFAAYLVEYFSWKGDALAALKHAESGMTRAVVVKKKKIMGKSTGIEHFEEVPMKDSVIEGTLLLVVSCVQRMQEQVVVMMGELERVHASTTQTINDLLPHDSDPTKRQSLAEFRKKRDLIERVGKAVNSHNEKIKHVINAMNGSIKQTNPVSRVRKMLDLFIDEEVVLVSSLEAA
jgi:hypothetical protein